MRLCLWSCGRRPWRQCSAQYAVWKITRWLGLSCMRGLKRSIWKSLTVKWIASVPACRLPAGRQGRKVPRGLATGLASECYKKCFYWDLCGYISSFPQKNSIAILKFSNFLNPLAADFTCWILLFSPSATAFVIRWVKYVKIFSRCLFSFLATSAIGKRRACVAHQYHFLKKFLAAFS